MYSSAKINLKQLILNLIIPLAVGGISAFVTMGEMDILEKLNTPMLTPPKIVFPIVWTILFILMGISSYLVSQSNVLDADKASALMIYGLQLAVNFIWPLLFFNGQKFFGAFICLLVLLVLVIVMTVKFYKINKTAGLLQIPYIVWLIFAGYLNLSVYLMNR